MRFKIDECLGPSAKALIAADGHDVMTVHEQSLSGAADQRIYEVCRDEDRVIVTLDHDFGQTTSISTRCDSWHRRDRMQGPTLAGNDLQVRLGVRRGVEDKADRS